MEEKFEELKTSQIQILKANNDSGGSNVAIDTGFNHIRSTTESVTSVTYDNGTDSDLICIEIDTTKTIATKKEPNNTCNGYNDLS